VPYDPALVVERQVERLVELGYPGLCTLDESAFRELLAPLAELAAGVPEQDDVAFVMVVTRELVRPEDTVPLLRLVDGRKPGVVDRNHAAGDLATYHPLPELGLDVLDCGHPPKAYLLTGIQRGEEFCNVRPEDALPVIRGRGRTPLTIDEGIAVVTHAPHLLEKNKCFMLSGSRRHDRRVPAMWISQGAPKLGWCWDGNPHTWLGVASARGRLVA
jgi:Family of unknown function (DUF5701)